METKSARFENTFCAECVEDARRSFGTTCCERNPCLYAPSDFGEMPEEVLAGVEKAVKEKRAALTYARRWENDRILVRAPGIYDEESYAYGVEELIVDPMVFREYHPRGQMGEYPCSFLTSEGCSRTLDERPLGGALHACAKLQDAMGDEWEKLAAETREIREPMNWEAYQTQLRELAVRLYKEMRA